MSTKSAIRVDASMRPADKTAGLVIARGTHFNPVKKITAADQEMPIAIRPLPRSMHAKDDLTGRVVGLFAVLGLARDTNERWVVRCTSCTLANSASVFSPRMASSATLALNEHDDQHGDGSMAKAASAYAWASRGPAYCEGHEPAPAPAFWPWDVSSWKPGDPRRMLVKASALMLAEIDRLDRAERRASLHAGNT